MSFCKVYVAGAVLASSLALVGCGSTGTVAPISTTAVSTVNQNAAVVTNEVVTGVESVCHYAPSVVDVASLVATFSGKGVTAVNLADSLVSKICGAVNSKVSSRRGSSASAVVVDGVVIHGERV